MKRNALKQALQQGKTVFGTMVQEIRSPAVAMVMATAGFDFLFIDMEHGAYDLETVADLIKVARLSGLTPLVRVPDAQYHLISRVLDAGAQGFMVPRVETRETVEQVVQWAKFPPLGSRGCSPFKGHADYRPEPMWEFTRQANEDTMVILQIERKAAIEDIEGLLAVPGVDAAILGPNDLALSLGIAEDMSNPVMIESIDKVVQACERRGIPCGMHVGDLNALKNWMSKGMRLVVYSTDLSFLLSGARSGLKVLRDAAQS
jgi:2-keto-3-deoxy-L-rhamnonate aldolase RhmA